MLFWESWGLPTLTKVYIADSRCDDYRNRSLHTTDVYTGGLYFKKIVGMLCWYSLALGIVLNKFITTVFTSCVKVNVFTTAPPAPAVTSITLTQSSTNSSSLLISWSMSDCAVQYVVTIINSSDDSVYPNITTSDTNTTVTLPTGVEFCVTVLGVDSINRTGPASEPQCYSEYVIVYLSRNAHFSMHKNPKATG